jgi:hypothetical protein
LVERLDIHRDEEVVVSFVPFFVRRFWELLRHISTIARRGTFWAVRCDYRCCGRWREGLTCKLHNQRMFW